MSLQQAINLYEDEKNRKELQRIQTERLRLQEEQVALQRQQMKEEQEYRAQQLALAEEKKNIDVGSVLAAVGSAAIIIHKIRKNLK